MDAAQQTLGLQLREVASNGHVGDGEPGAEVADREPLAGVEQLQDGVMTFLG